MYVIIKYLPIFLEWFITKTMCRGVGSGRSFHQNQGNNFKVCIFLKEEIIIILSNWFNFFISKLFGPIIQQIFDPISIMLLQMDFLKDMILVTRLITLLGGIVVFSNPQLFSSNVSKFIEVNYLILLFYNSYILDHLLATWNNLCPPIPWNIKLYCIKSSKQEWL